MLNQTIKGVRFALHSLAGILTTRRVLAFAVIALLISGCRQTTETTTISTTPANQTATDKPAVSRAPVPLPVSILTAKAETIDGGSLQLADYKGKVVVLDMWATWCPPCRAEIPHLVELQREFGERGVQVIGLTTEDPEEASEAVKDFAREYDINYKIGWATSAHKRLVVQGGGTIPQTFVLDTEGRVVRHLPGFHPTKSLPVLRQAIEEALTSANL